MSKVLSQNAIGRALDLSSAAMVKLKKQGCPMDSVEAAQAWREARQNVAARKPMPAAAPVPAPGPIPTHQAIAPLHTTRAMEGAPTSPIDPETDRMQRVGGDYFRDMIRANDVAFDGSELSEDHQAARTRREIAEANLAEIKEAEQRGKYLQKADVDAAVFEIARAMRDGLTNCARRIAAEVSTLTTTDACETVIEREHRALLDSMAHQIGVRLGAGSQAEQTI